MILPDESYANYPLKWLGRGFCTLRAEDLQDLLAVSGNRLEKLEGNRAGQFSIRINDQWRICFEWDGHKAHQVEIVDYHS